MRRSEMLSIFSTTGLASIASAGYVSVFNTCRSSGIKAYFSQADDESNADLIATLSYTGAYTTDKLTYSPAYFWLRDDDDNLLLSGNFSFFTFGSNALGYIESSGSNCIPQKIELDATYSSRASVIYVNSIGVEDQYVFFDDELEGVVETEGSNTVLVTSYSGKFVTKDSHIEFCNDTSSNSTCTWTGYGDMTIPAGDAAFFVIYFPSSSSSRSIEWFSATGSISGWTWDDNIFDDDLVPSLSDGAIAGIVIGVVVFVGIVCFCIYYCTCRTKKKNVEDTVALHGAM